MVTLTPSVTGKTGKPVSGMVARTNRLLTVSIEELDAGWAGIGQPVTYRFEYSASKAATDRVYVSNLQGFGVYEGGFFTGFTADIYVVTNGARVKLASGTVTGGKTWLRDFYLGDNQMVTETTAQVKHETYFRPNFAFYYRVAAINSSGGIGTYTAWTPYTTPSPIPSGTASNATAAITFNGTSALAAPANLAIAPKSGEAGVAVLTWDSVAGAVGYVVERSYQNPANNADTENDEYFDLDTTGLSIPQGAHVILRKKLLTCPTTVCARVWDVSAVFLGFALPACGFRPERELTGVGAEWIAYTGGDPAPSGINAPYYLRYKRQTSGTGTTYVFHSGKDEPFYDTLAVGTNVTFRVLMRSVGGTGSFSMGLQGMDNVTGNTSFTSTTDFAWYEVTGTINTLKTGSAIYNATFTPNNTLLYDIASIELVETGVNINDQPTALQDALPAGSFVRDHRHIKPGPSTNDLETLVLPSNFGARKNGSATLHSLLWQCKTHGCNPWIQLEWHLPEQEWIDLVDYLCAPVSSGNAWALKRQAEGQTTPWIDEFPEMLLEFGNEPWNTLSTFWNPPGMVDTATAQSYGGSAYYGILCQHLIDQMKTSAYWTKFRAKTKFIAGGFVLNDYSTQALLQSSDLDYGSVAAYNGGWRRMIGGPTENSDTFLALLAISNNASNWVTRRDETLAVSGKRILVYEAGPDYALTGLGGASLSDAENLAQEVGLKSRASATGAIDAFCYITALGYDVNNFFKAKYADLWSTHPYRGHRTGEPFIQFGVLKLINDAVGLCQVKELTTVQSPTRPQDGKPGIRAYLIRSLENPTTCVIAALNLQIDVSLLEVTDPLYNATPSGLEPITVNTPIVSCTGLDYFANVGNFREHNRYAPGERYDGSGSFIADSLCVAIPTSWTPGTPLGDASTIVIDNTYGAAASGLPAGNCVLIKMTGCVFE